MAPRGAGKVTGAQRKLAENHFSPAFLESQRDQALPGSHRSLCQSVRFSLKQRFTYLTGGIILTLAKAVINI